MINYLDFTEKRIIKMLDSIVYIVITISFLSLVISAIDLWLLYRILIN